ncbi:hypothetical protein C9374_001683 [Naegleria lovaniensis]|uniref:Uncharacterized protein n=1 Tax=Naegleria lovaniensis TaxID=51637 RepID=A0AA88GWS5_NAELO|nr:uncharacterized protein C9374_001683 [Naegleria lovaniensis]KAG2387351.1 hypothetical protein C9374_001683 [Naegleria lovaniensis]
MTSHSSTAAPSEQNNNSNENNVDDQKELTQNINTFLKFYSMFSPSSIISNKTPLQVESDEEDDEILKHFAAKKQKYEKSKMSKLAKKRYKNKLAIESDDEDDSEDEDLIFNDDASENSKKRKRKDDNDSNAMKFSKVVDVFDDGAESDEPSSSRNSKKQIKKAISEKLKHQSKLSHMKHGDKIAKEEKMQSAMTKIVKGRDDNDVRVLQSKLKKQEQLAKRKQKQKKQQTNSTNSERKRAGFEGRSNGKINDIQNLQKLKQKVR